MNKLIIIAIILVSAFAFNINKQPIVSETVDRQLKAINWPFTTCGDGQWDIQKLTLGSTPARNTNDSIDVVYIFSYHRQEKPDKPSISRMCYSVLNWTDPHFTLKLLPSLNHSTVETQSNSNSSTLFHPSPHLEPMD